MANLQRALTLLTSLLTLLTFASTATATCYYPSGNTSNNEFPCGNGDTICCPENWSCLQNGLCADPTGGFIKRFSCTNDQWNGCPTGAENCVRRESWYGAEDVNFCGPGHDFCCNLNKPEMYGNPSCCDAEQPQEFSGTDGFTAFAKIQAGKWMATSSNMLFSTVHPTMTASAAAGSTPSSSGISTVEKSGALAHTRTSSSGATTAPSSTDPSSSAFVSHRPIQTSSTPSSSTDAIAPPATDSDRDDDNSSGSSATKIVAMAVAIPIGLVAICVLAWLLYRRAKAKKAAQTQRPPSPVLPHTENFFHGPTEKQSPTTTTNDRYSVLAPSEIDSREVRIPISPADTAPLTARSDPSREDTTNTLYPNAQNDYSQWGVSPTLQQQRWSGTTALNTPQGRHDGEGQGERQQLQGGQAHGQQGQQPTELMGRPRIPSTIAELPG